MEAKMYNRFDFGFLWRLSSPTRVWQRRIAIICLLGIIWGKSFAFSIGVPICPKESVRDSIVGVLDPVCPLDCCDDSSGLIRVTEGDDVTLKDALDALDKNGYKYVAVLFYASWCPFSRSFRPIFSLLSSLYPSINHIAIEESSIRPSVLSIYGVHGFPAVFLMNSTKRVRYHGPRTLGSVVDLFADISGIKPPTDRGSLDKMVPPSNIENHNKIGEEISLFALARSPEKFLKQEKYLALATAFVLARLMFIIFPALLSFAQLAWQRIIQRLRLVNLFEHPRAYLNGVVHLFNSLKEPWRKRNLQEGAINARAWASKSLATVSISEASTSRM